MLVYQARPGRKKCCITKYFRKLLSDALVRDELHTDAAAPGRCGRVRRGRRKYWGRCSFYAVRRSAASGIHSISSGEQHTGVVDQFVSYTRTSADIDVAHSNTYTAKASSYRLAWSLPITIRIERNTISNAIVESTFKGTFQKTVAAFPADSQFTVAILCSTAFANSRQIAVSVSVFATFQFQRSSAQYTV